MKAVGTVVAPAGQAARGPQPMMDAAVTSDCSTCRCSRLQMWAKKKKKEEENERKKRKSKSEKKANRPGSP